MSDEYVPVSKGTWDALCEVLSSRTTKIMLIALAALITVVGYLAYKPQASGQLAPLVTLWYSYSYGFFAVASAVITDMSLAAITANVAKWLFTAALAFTLIKPLFKAENLIKLLVYGVLLATMALVVLAAIKVAAGSVTTIPVPPVT